MVKPIFAPQLVLLIIITFETTLLSINISHPFMQKKSILNILAALFVNFLFATLTFAGTDIAGSKTLTFENISFNEGLSNLQINAICQDDLGYIWVGTARGLNRFDGFGMEQFFFLSNDSNSISDDYIGKMKNRPGLGLLIIAQGGEVDLYDIKKEKIFRLKSSGELLTNICEWNGQFYFNSRAGKLCRFDEDSLHISKLGSFPDSLLASNIFPDEKLGLLCTLYGSNGFVGMVSFNPVSNKTSRIDFFDSPIFTADFLINDIQRIGNWLWVASNKGLLLYDDKNQKAFKMEGSVLDAVKAMDIRFIGTKNKNEIWIGTYDSGLFICDTALTKLKHVDNELEVGSPRKNLLTDCFSDRDKNMWVGTFNNGLKVSYNSEKRFNSDPYLNNLTKGRFITSILADQNGNYYIGTRESGLIEYNKTSLAHRVYSTSNSAIAGNFVCRLFEDSQGKIWVGQPNSLQLFDRKTGNFKSLGVPNNCGEILSFAETENHNVFMGTDASGILNFEIDGKFVRSIKETGLNIRLVSLRKNNEIIVCSILKGIFTYNTITDRMNKIGADVQRKEWIEANFLCYYIDSDSILWVGNFKWGLIRFDLATDSIKVYNMSDGLPSNDVVGIVEDKNGFLWLSTSYGLSRFDKNGNFMNFSMADGIENQQFHQNAVCVSKHLLYFGGNYGATELNPDRFLTLNEKPPEVIFKNLFINNNKILPESGSKTLSQNLAFTKAIVLSHKQKTISIDYVSLDFAETDKVSYSYFMEGFDKEWVNAGKTKRAVYSNLLPGNYTFMVKAQKNNSEFSSETLLKIKVKQTPWLSSWAILLYSVVLFTIIFIIFWLSFRAQLFRKEKEMEHVERLRENEVHIMKMKFFANISHEFRTPLTVISGVTYLISKQIKLTGYSQDLFSSLHQNVDRLLRLINQLLTFRELESDTLSLGISENNINKHIEIICNNFVYYARLKEISLLYESATRFELILFYDSDKIEKILSNLISNALKHTQNGGSIAVGSTKISKADAMEKYAFLQNNKFPLSESGYLEISVEDTGEGIKPKYIDSIFERFKMGGESNRKDFSSSGIGLDFVKRLINIHKGDITVKSVYNEGSVFSFVLPLDKNVFNANEFIEANELKINKPSSLPVFLNIDKTVGEPLAGNRKKYKVAIIEDNAELRKMVSETLSNFYRVVTANDGEMGLALIHKEHPDMVISDVMMPKMDGIELCQKIKSDENFSHISFVLLSARSEVADQIEGIKNGADIYIPKPFNLEYLMTVVERLFDNKEKLHKIYMKGLIPNLEETEINFDSMQLLRKFNTILEKQITNVDLSVETLAAEMNMGRSNFYKKFMDITNITPNAYIVKYRMNKAAELLKENKYSLSEISDMIGCRNASYFSTIFKKEKNMSPREFVKSLKK
ncbi:two-component regulator propeller domain-containing protein [Draconibacterium sp.]